MKRKKLVTILTALVVAVSSSIPVFASQNTAENSKIETNISSDYITSVIQSNSDIDPYLSMDRKYSSTRSDSYL